MKNQVGEMIRSTKVKKQTLENFFGGAPDAPPSKSATVTVTSS